MKKYIILFIFIIFLIVGLSSIAYSQVRLDININVPVYFGASLGNESGGVAVGAFIPIPELQVHYIFDFDMLRLGLGVRIFTLIIESLLYPNIFLEVDLDPIVLRADVGGGLFVVFGLIGGSGTAPIVLGDLNASFKVNEWLRLGGGFYLITNPELNEDIGTEAAIFVGYIQARFLFHF